MCSSHGDLDDGSFCIVMRSELLENYCLILPVSEEFGSGKGRTVILETRSSLEWKIEYEPLEVSMIRLGAEGWNAFCVYNQIKPGDSLVFTPKPGTIRFCVLVFGNDGIERLPRIQWARRRARVHHRNPNAVSNSL